MADTTNCKSPVIMAHVTAHKFLSPTMDNKRVKVVHLSGPIKVILPIDEYEEVETINVAHRDSDLETPIIITPVTAPKNTNIVHPSGPINIILPVDLCDNTRIDGLAPNADTTNTASSTMEKPTPVAREFDCNHPDDTLSPFCPYVPGNEIFLKTCDDGVPLKAVILKYFPATLSCCMVIRFIAPHTFNNTSECVIKLYDRRFSTQHREDWEAEPWTPELEKDYQEFVDCGDAEEFFSYWDAEKECEDDWSAADVKNRKRWSAAKREAYLQWESITTYEIEKKAYEQMAKLQGKDVPKLFGEVLLDHTFIGVEEGGQDGMDLDQTKEDAESISSSDEDSDPRIVSIPGILIQHIKGFHLTDLHEHLPRDNWQSTVDSAIKTLNHIQECGILNRDLNTRNFIVDSLTRDVMMIDFGIISFREDVQDDREWDELQAAEDEEGAVGLLMKTYLKERGGGSIIYKPSERALRLAWRFHQETGENDGDTEEEDEYVKQKMGSVSK
ncbi:hypothetical protein D6C77_08253 [Aureobasidium pullulans]|nr:hypothetical protein D6C77_08253 [Aureobasidium pullulans]